jgi:ABC-type Mn2+/Zn2+ transport system permease subunit
MYLTHRERRAILYAIAIAGTIAIAGLAVGFAFPCPPGIFC